MHPSPDFSLAHAHESILAEVQAAADRAVHQSDVWRANFDFVFRVQFKKRRY